MTRKFYRNGNDISVIVRPQIGSECLWMPVESIAPLVFLIGYSTGETVTWIRQSRL